MGAGAEDAAPSRVNEAVFLRQFVTLADQEGVDYNLIEAFDQNWKYEDEGVAGANWGIWNAHRELKFPLNGAGGRAAELALVRSARGDCRDAAVRRRGVSQIRAWRCPSFALGNGFAIACMGTLPMLYDHWLELDALVNLPLQAIFAVMVIRRADAVLSRAPLPPVTTGALCWRRCGAGG